MNQIVVFIQLFFSFLFANSFYDNQITTLDGQQIDLSSFANQQVLIVPFNQSAECANQLLQLDSLQKTDDSIKIIATPAIDFESTSAVDSLQTFTDSLGLGAIIITQPVKVKKSEDQNGLYQWLTRVDYNKHFDDDVPSAGRIFIINNNGVLFAITQQDISMSNLTSLIYSTKTPNY